MKLRITALAAIMAAMALTAACGKQVPAPEDVATSDCAARGGVMTPVGRMQSLQCVIVYSDAGKTCRSGSDCQGDCRAPGGVVVPEGREVAGVCAPDSNRFGCHTTIENGRAEPTLCVD